jgi:hypothetical protein
MNATRRTIDRILVCGFSALLVCLLSSQTQAKTSCVQTPQGTYCTSEVDFSDFYQRAFDTQKESQWCWAASISMVFSYHGHSVSQQRIVSAAYGGIVNMPAVTGMTIARQIARPWSDDSGETFKSALSSAYDYDAGVYATNNAIMINELDNDRPFIIGTAGHAVVVTHMEYFPTQMGPNVRAVGVFDPWPGRGARNLSVFEMTPKNQNGGLMFIATVSVFN